MTLKRIYTFEPGEGFGLKRVPPKEGIPEDQILVAAAITNWQLAILYVIDLEKAATGSEIGFALVMDRPTVVQNIRPLEKRGAVKKVPSRGGRKGAVELTHDGRELLEFGLTLWRTAKASAQKATSKPAESIREASRTLAIHHQNIAEIG